MSEQIKKFVPEKCDMVRCGSCKWEGKVEDAIEDTDSEGWEYPSYIVHYCPKCENEDQLDEYFYSEEYLIGQYEKRIAELELQLASYKKYENNISETLNYLFKNGNDN